MSAAGTNCVHRLVADVCIIAEGAVLLVRYSDTSKYDGERGWFLPDDFLAEGEHPLRAARRILHEQVGLSNLRPALGFIDSFGNGVWHLIFHHRVALGSPPPVCAIESARRGALVHVGHTPTGRRCRTRRLGPRAHRASSQG